MKMMDLGEQDDCYIDATFSPKKKKMKQAQLPFQLQSSAQSSNVIQSKKRKLTSPTVDSRSPKAIKIPKKHSRQSIVSSNLSDNDSDGKKNSCDIIEVKEDTEIDNVKENTTFNKVETDSINKSSKWNSVEQKMLEKSERIKPSPLAKFLQKTEKVDGKLIEDCQNSAEQKDGLDDMSIGTEHNKKVSESTHNLSNKAEDSFSVVDNSMCQSDSDVKISTDDEDKDDESKPTVDTEKSSTDSSQILLTPKRELPKHKKLTPKQREKKILSAKKKEKQRILKMERERKLEEERQNRRKEKEEKRKKKAEREKAEKEQKMMEKKMREQKKQIEVEQKQKEKLAKEEERRKKEEERRKKEEEKMEAERRKQKAASNFTSFFVAKKHEKSVEDENVVEVKNFMPFEVKGDMKIAPICRRTLNEQEKLLMDKKCNEGKTEVSDLYISEIKDKRIIPRKSFKTWPLEAKDDVIILDDENDGNSNIVNHNIVVEEHRPKLLQFCENQRPPYWGTWRKRSGHINPRRPFSKDTKWFNYEVDSDDEWEEEEPGESLHGSDDEKDEENPEDNEYDVDNEFMVPHGYLSDEEVGAAGEHKEDMSPETQKFKLKVLGEQFEDDRNTKTSKLKPKIIGCIWRGPDNKFPPNVPPRTVDFLSAREAWVREIPLVLSAVSDNEATIGNECCTPTRLHATSSKKTRVPEAALPDLVRLLHGNTNGRRFIMKEFQTYWNKKNNTDGHHISKASLLQKIREIGKWRPCPEEGPMHMKACWYVGKEIRKKYVDEELVLPNQWSYNLTPRIKCDHSETVEKFEKDDKDKEKKSVHLITQFTKKITQEEMKRQLAVKPSPTTTKTNNTASTKPPKRVALISVGRGEQFSKTSKENLLKDLVSIDETKNKYSDESNGSDDGVIVLDSFETTQKEKELPVEYNEKSSKNVDEKQDSVQPERNGSIENEVSMNVNETIDLHVQTST